MLTALGWGIAPRRARLVRCSIRCSTTAGLCFWETVAPLAPSSPAPVPGRRLLIKASKLFRLLISHLKRLVNVEGAGSMVDGSLVTAQIVFKGGWISRHGIRTRSRWS
ncbi:hypothetical protein IGI04_013163 [Brassica rapa subsp. trilocularis]|uniref:Uncharacterized protein n=1 Tax=Brassica rapa subsp. trilocularis TaxID=1813537 RepID=A0ABQ7N815_BRACM|nr:hypothetical protein IGI04_013163 [Brassica rapa subsp. trilocularis]